MSGFEPSMFYEAASMEDATLAVQAAGSTPPAVNAVHDLVRSGAYRMPGVVEDGGYAIFCLSPLIIDGEGGVYLEPLEFKATEMGIGLREWSAEVVEKIADGNKMLSQGVLRLSTNARKFATGAALTLLSLESMGGVGLEQVKQAVSDTPSRMLGGIVTAAQFHPSPDNTVKFMGIPYWHRALPLMINGEELLQSMPRILRKRIEPFIGDPEVVAGLALVHLFNIATVHDLVVVGENVNLRLPPEQFFT